MSIAVNSVNVSRRLVLRDIQPDGERKTTVLQPDSFCLPSAVTKLIPDPKMF